MLCVFALVMNSGGALEAQMQVRVSSDTTEYDPGQPIHLRLVVENTGNDSVRLEFTSAQRYEFEIRDQADRVLWRWSEEMGFAQMLGEERLPPGGVLRYEEAFTDSLPAGAYAVIGRVTARQGGLSDRRSIRVR